MGATDDVLSYLVELTAGKAPGTRLPSERDLARKLGISRNAVHANVQHLVVAGRLTTQHGSGLFVAEPKAVIHLGEPGGGRDEQSGRRRFESLVLDTGEGVAEAGLAAAIGAATGARTIEFRRLLLDGSDPVAAETVVLTPPAPAATTGAAFFDLLDRVPVAGTRTISCELAAGRICRLLGVPVAQPLLVVERVQDLRSAEVRVHVRTWYRADRFVLRGQLTTEH
ncbi:GntR family transcriptional regulator [Amycolatopsis sp. NPDC051061]|uniref:GntR family transcriptional regulator n=1 Tax=Amycolatopsis sp. NPDC051061 TaxID=3155042 RepID=UPI003440CE0E